MNVIIEKNVEGLKLKKSDIIISEIKEYIKIQEINEDLNYLKCIKPIFLFGDKGVGKSFLINEIKLSLEKKDVDEYTKKENKINNVFIVEANKLEELKDEIYDLTEGSGASKLWRKFLKNLRKNVGNTLIYLSIILPFLLGLLVTGIIKLTTIYIEPGKDLSKIWLNNQTIIIMWFIFSGLSLIFVIINITFFIYILSYPSSLKGKLNLSFKKLAKKYATDKGHIYIFIDDLNRVIEKKEVYKIYKFIDFLYKKQSCKKEHNENNRKKEKKHCFMKNIIIIYVNENRFFETFNKSKNKDIGKYIGKEIYVTIEDTINDVIKLFKEEYEKLKKIEVNSEVWKSVDSRFLKLIEDFTSFIKLTDEMLHKAMFYLDEFKLFVNLSEDKKDKFKFLFLKKEKKLKDSYILDIFIYIKMIFLKAFSKEAYTELAGVFLQKYSSHPKSIYVPNVEINVSLFYEKKELNKLISSGPKWLINPVDKYNFTYLVNANYNELTNENIQNLYKFLRKYKESLFILNSFPKLAFFEKLFPGFETSPIEGNDPLQTNTEYDYFIFDDIYSYNIDKIYMTYEEGLCPDKRASSNMVDYIKRSLILKK